MTHRPKFDSSLSKILGTDGDAYACLAVPIGGTIAFVLIGTPVFLGLYLFGPDFKVQDLFDAVEASRPGPTLLVLAIVTFCVLPLRALIRARHVQEALLNGLPIRGIVVQSHRGPAWTVSVRYDYGGMEWRKAIRTHGPDDLAKLEVGRSVWIVVLPYRPDACVLAELYALPLA